MWDGLHYNQQRVPLCCLLGEGQSVVFGAVEGERVGGEATWCLNPKPEFEKIRSRHDLFRYLREVTTVFLIDGSTVQLVQKVPWRSGPA